jgi:hypothetical protein
MMLSVLCSADLTSRQLRLMNMQEVQTLGSDNDDVNTGTEVRLEIIDERVGPRIRDLEREPLRTTRRRPVGDAQCDTDTRLGRYEIHSVDT